MLFTPKNMSTWFMDDPFAKFASYISKLSLIFLKIDMIYINRYLKRKTFYKIEAKYVECHSIF